MADATVTTGLFSLIQTSEAERLAARRHLITERRLSPDEARELWTFGGDAEALKLFRSLTPAAQRERKAEFRQGARQLHDQLCEDAAKAQAQLSPAWLALLQQAAVKELKRAQSRKESKSARRRAAKAQARCNTELTVAPAPVQAITLPAETPVEATPVQDEVIKTESETPAAKSLEQQLSDLKDRGDSHTRAVRQQIKAIEAKIRAQAGAERRAREKAEAERATRAAKLEAERAAAEQKAADELQAKRQRNTKAFGIACSCCGYGLTQRNRWVPPIDEMAADIGREVQVTDLESFVRCGRCADEADYPLANTQRVLAARDQRRAEAAERQKERQKVIDADRATRAAAQATEQKAERERQQRLQMLKLRSRGRFTHGNGIRNPEGRC